MTKVDATEFWISWVQCQSSSAKAACGRVFGCSCLNFESMQYCQYCQYCSLRVRRCPRPMRRSKATMPLTQNQNIATCTSLNRRSMKKLMHFESFWHIFISWNHDSSDSSYLIMFSFVSQGTVIGWEGPCRTMAQVSTLKPRFGSYSLLPC